MSRPILGVVSVFAVIATWKDYLWPLLVLRDPDIQPLSVRLPILAPTTDLGVFIAALTISSLIPIALFLLFQRLFLQGSRRERGAEGLVRGRAGVRGSDPPRWRRPSSASVRPLLGPVAGRLGLVATGRHAAPAPAAGPRRVVEDPAAAVVVADPDALGVPAGQLAHERVGQARQGVVDRVADVAVVDVARRRAPG